MRVIHRNAKSCGKSEQTFSQELLDRYMMSHDITTVHRNYYKALIDEKLRTTTFKISTRMKVAYYQ